MADGITTSGITIGLDLGDRQTAGCVLDATGQVLTRWQVRTTRSGLQAAVAPWPGARVILEVGPQSPWVSRGLTAAGYAVVVANARRVRLIAESDAKSDRLDAEGLARLGRVDPALLAPIQHRREQTQRALGVAKALGHRLPACAAEAFPARVRAHAAGPALPGIEELLAVLEQLTVSIRASARTLATLARTRYPVTELLQQVPGVGPLTALTDVLTLEDPTRFPRSRTVGEGRQETGGRGGRPQTGRAAASAVANRRGLRPRGLSDAGGPRRLTGGAGAARLDDGRTAD